MKAIKKPVIIDFEFALEDGEVEALGGKVSYKKGDAIITGVKGEKYPCRRDIFDQTYSVVNDSLGIDLELILKAMRRCAFCTFFNSDNSVSSQKGRSK